MNIEKFQERYCKCCSSLVCQGILDKETRQGCFYYKYYTNDNTSVYICPQCGRIAYYDSYFGRIMCTNSHCNFESKLVDKDKTFFIKELNKMDKNQRLLKETTGHILEIGDKVKINISAFEDSDRDGVEFTTSGKNYWRYMNQHPEEVYTVVGFDNVTDSEVTTYLLSGYMEDTNWYSDELILLPKPSTVFEVIKNMTIEEMANLFSTKTCLTQAKMLEWLNEKPTNGGNI